MTASHTKFILGLPVTALGALCKARHAGYCPKTCFHIVCGITGAYVNIPPGFCDSMGIFFNIVKGLRLL